MAVSLASKKSIYLQKRPSHQVQPHLSVSHRTVGFTSRPRPGIRFDLAERSKAISALSEVVNFNPRTRESKTSRVDED